MTAESLAASLGVRRSVVESALAALESEGFVFRGRFTPGLGIEEWCERRLLARIHRYTLDRLRREIEPVSQADYRALPPGLAAGGSRRAGRGAGEPARPGGAARRVRGGGGRLGGGDPAGADEGVRPRRGWTPCASRAASSGAGPSARTEAARGGRPVRATPIALLCAGRTCPFWREIAPRALNPGRARPLADARAVYELLRTRGASFFGDIAHGAGLLHTQLEMALAELVAWGLVTSDSFTGLRALLVPGAQAAARGPLGPARDLASRSSAWRTPAAGRCCIVERPWSRRVSRADAVGDRRVDAAAPLRRGLPPAPGAGDPAAPLAGRTATGAGSTDEVRVLDVDVLKHHTPDAPRSITTANDGSAYPLGTKRHNGIWSRSEA